MARRRRRLPALDQGLDGDDQRPARAALLHPPLQDRRSERRDLVQRRQRRPDARPALGDRRRVPRARPPRRAVRDRSGHPRLAARRGRDDPLRYCQRAGLAPLQRRRLRRSFQRRQPVGAFGRRHRTPLAGAFRRARRADAADRRRGRRCVPARRHGPVRRRRRPHSRAGLGVREPRAFAVRHGARDRLDRLRRRPARRLGGPAQLVGGLVCAAVRRHRRGPTGRPAAEHVPALRRAHPGDDAAHGDEPGRPERGERIAGHGHRHNGARQQGLRVGHQHGRELGHDERDDHRRWGRRVQHHGRL